jgi:catalase
MIERFPEMKSPPFGRQRGNHIKGRCAAGEFVGRADAAPAPRGMALEFHLPGGALQLITMIDAPILAGASPASFHDHLLAARADLKTGQPDPEKLKAFATTHPDAMVLTELASQRSFE